MVIDVIDTFVLDFGYDKKTVEKIFYKKHKLNDFDDLTTEEVLELEDEVKDALGITESKKSMKESKHHKLIDYFDKAIPHYNIAIRDIDSDSELFFGEMNDLKNCSYRNFTVIECGINSPYYEDIDCLVFYIDLDEDVFC